LSASQFSFIDTSVIGGRTYKYVVTSYNVLGGESIYSNNVNVTPSTRPSGMAAPTEVTHDLTSVTLQWNYPVSNGASPVTSFILYHKADYETSYQKIF
jgi:hypothetical protein